MVFSELRHLVAVVVASDRPESCSSPDEAADLPIVWRDDEVPQPWTVFSEHVLITFLGPFTKKLRDFEGLDLDEVRFQQGKDDTDEGGSMPLRKAQGLDLDV